MIATRRLVKVFGRTQVLRDLDLEIATGEAVALVGPPGSGRTTLLRILGTLVPPTSGAVTIDGLDAVADVYRVRSRVALVDDGAVAAGGLPAREHVQWLSAARLAEAGSTRPSAVAEGLRRADLSPDVIVDTLSPQMQARLSLVVAILQRPRVLLLDDPCLAFDGDGGAALVDWLREVRDAGTTMVVATGDDGPLMPLCHRVEQMGSR